MKPLVSLQVERRRGCVQKSPLNALAPVLFSLTPYSTGSTAHILLSEMNGML